MMIQVFFAAMAFSLGLIAFATGAWLTVWGCSNNNQYVGAAKLSGYFITVLAIISLVFTSYYVARTMFMTDYSRRSMVINPNKHKTMMKKEGANRPGRPTTTNTTPRGQ